VRMKGGNCGCGNTTMVGGGCGCAKGMMKGGNCGCGNSTMVGGKRNMKRIITKKKRYSS